MGYNKARSVKKGRSSTFVAKMARKNMPAHVVEAIGSDRRGRQPIVKERLRKPWKSKTIKIIVPNLE